MRRRLESQKASNNVCLDYLLAFLLNFNSPYVVRLQLAVPILLIHGAQAASR
jgi:hypothetical protein